MDKKKLYRLEIVRPIGYALVFASSREEARMKEHQGIEAMYEEYIDDYEIVAGKPQEEDMDLFEPEELEAMQRIQSGMEAKEAERTALMSR